MKNTIKYITLLIGITGYAQLETINKSYQYDNLNRLVQVVSNEGDGFENNYEYDKLGNRLSKDSDNANNPNLTYVPDDAFEQKLIDEGFDDLMDDYVVTDNINDIEILYVSDLGIEDLTGIEDFSSLVNFECLNNNLTTIDISQNSNLERFYCAYNQITGLDVSQNSSLKYLYAFDNQLTEIDVSQNLNLLELQVDQNNISIVDVSHNNLLEELRCGENLINEIDLSNNNNLERLSCRNLGLTNLDFSNNLLLESLVCSGNNLTEIDLSQHSNIVYLKCFNNNLNSLNLKNGNNIILNYMRAQNNPNLFCIQVDDEDAANNGNGVYENWDVDPQVTFSESCALGIDDNNIANEIIITPNPASETLSIILPDTIVSNISDIKIYDLNGRIVFDEEISSQNQQIDISIKLLAEGTYSIEVINENNTWKKLFIKN